MGKKWDQQKDERRAARAAKQAAWEAHHRKHQPLSPEQRKSLPKPKGEKR